MGPMNPADFVAASKAIGATRGAPQKVMASPPTLTTGSVATLTRPWPTAHGGGGPNDAPDGVVSWVRCKPEALAAASSPIFRGVTLNAEGTSWTNSTVGAIIMHYGSAVEFAFGPSATSYLLKVDDEYVSFTPTTIPNSGTPFHKWTFGSAALRRIEIIGYNISLINIWTADTDNVTPALVRGPKCVILGDSFTNIAPYGIGLAFGDAMGWDDVQQSGIGGTGLVNPGSFITLGQRVQSDVIRFNPDVAIVMDLANDYGKTPSEVSAAATSLLATMRASLPNAILAFAPNAQYGWGATSMTANALAVYKATKAAVQAAGPGTFFLDLLDMPAPTNVARASGLVSSSSNSASAGSGIVPMNFQPPIGSTVELDGASATIGERVVVKSITQRSGTVWDVYIDGTLKYTHTAGVSTAAVVGNSILIGRGNSSSPTGYGSADIFLDGTQHPTPAGRQAFGYQMAALFRQQLATLYPSGTSL